MGFGMKIKGLINRFGYDVRYHRPLYDIVIGPLGIKTVLDIGANDGKYSLEMCERFPDARIYAFEPLADCFSRLSEVAKQHPNIIPFDTALGEETGALDIERSSFHPSSSILRMSSLHKKLYPKSAATIKERIKVARLDDIMRGQAIENPLLIKIDVQGYEGSVIRGGAETIRRAACIQVETSFFSLYEGQPLFDDVAKMLHELGFHYYGALQTHWSKTTGHPMYEDSLFISEKIREQFEQAELV